MRYRFIMFPSYFKKFLWYRKIDKLRAPKIHYPTLTDSLACTCTRLMTAHSPEVAAATIMADTSDDLVVFLWCNLILSARPLSSPRRSFRSATSSGNATTSNSTSYANYLCYNIPFAV